MTLPDASAPDAYTFSQKWGDDPFTGLGFTQCPVALIDYGAAIGLSMNECWLLVCILKYKKTPENPYPTQAKLASMVGRDETTIRRLIKGMENKGLLAIEKKRGEAGQWSHCEYNFIALRAALNTAHYAKLKADETATVQKCTVDTNNAGKEPDHRAKSGLTTVQFCPVKKSLKKSLKNTSESGFVGVEESAVGTVVLEQFLSENTDTGELFELTPDAPKSPPPPNASAIFLASFKLAGLPAPTLLPRHHRNLKTYRAAVDAAGLNFAAVCAGFTANPWAAARAHDVGILTAAVPEKWLAPQIEFMSNGYGHGGAENAEPAMVGDYSPHLAYLLDPEYKNRPEVIAREALRDKEVYARWAERDRLIAERAQADAEAQKATSRPKTPLSYYPGGWRSRAAARLQAGK